MEIISKDVALKFCKLCDWVYMSWVTHKTLFDDNRDPESNIGKAREFSVRLSLITQEYILQQISKLHDPAIQSDSINLTIDFIVRFGDWGVEEEYIKSLQNGLSELWQYIKPARTKTLAHNDLETIAYSSIIGSFKAGLDEKYFETLQSFVNKVHEKWFGGPYAFNDLAIADVKEFLALLEKV